MGARKVIVAVEYCEGIQQPIRKGSPGYLVSENRISGSVVSEALLSLSPFLALVAQHSI